MFESLCFACPARHVNNIGMRTPRVEHDYTVWKLSSIRPGGEERPAKEDPYSCDVQTLLNPKP